MSYQKRLIGTVALLFVILIAAGSTAGGCGETGAVNGPGQKGTTAYICAEPRDQHYDDFGEWDPCCNLKACCPNPNNDHFVEITVDPMFNHIWDPCCLAEPCPEVNVWLPQPDAGAPSAADDAGTDGQASLCSGQCVTVPDVGWSLPVQLWVGPPGEEPQCPGQAPHEGYRGHADLDAPPKTCGICGCDSPTGECGLPPHLTASTSVCNSGGILTPFDAPAAWDGSCTPKDAIPGGAQCNGSPCVKSLSIDPLTLIETKSCNPHVIVPKDGPTSGPAWKTSALACQVSDYPPCSPTQVCIPAAEPGFSICIATWGDDHKCSEPYTARYVFYDDYSDTRKCTDCSCEPPIGSICTAQLSLHKDDVCANPLLQGYTLASTGPGCIDFQMAGVALGSKAITNLAYIPGTCKPNGGEVTGDLTLIEAMTFCCLQS